MKGYFILVSAVTFKRLAYELKKMVKEDIREGFTLPCEKRNVRAEYYLKGFSDVTRLS